MRICLSANSSDGKIPLTGQKLQLMAERSMIRFPFKRRTASSPIPEASNQRNPKRRESLSTQFFPSDNSTSHTYRLGSSTLHNFASGADTGIFSSFMPLFNETPFISLE